LTNQAWIVLLEFMSSLSSISFTNNDGGGGDNDDDDVEEEGGVLNQKSSHPVGIL
jgi:hypothetical protein